MSRGKVLGAVIVASTIVGTGSVASPATAQRATPRIVGGEVIAIGQAPFVVAVTRPGGSCTGVLVDASMVWTAGHCAFDADSTPIGPGQITIRTGLSILTGTPAQTRAVASLRLHPGFVNDPGRTKPDDIATLSLASPLQVTADTRPIGPGPMPGEGAAVVQYGYGAQADGANDGRLRRMGAGVIAPATCGPFNATQVCSVSPSAAACPGDSGGPIVAGSGVVGIHSGGFCTPGRPGRATAVAPPEIALFLAGSDTPPTAPRAGTTTFDSFIPIVGQRMNCRADGFTGTAPLAVGATFVDQTTGALLQADGTPSRVLAPTDTGRLVACRISVSNAGGTFTGALMTTTRPIVPLRDAGLRITLRGSRLLFGGSTDAVSAALITTNRRGAAVQNRALRWPLRSASRPRLGIGSYSICVLTPQTVQVAAGRACAPYEVRGRASTLVGQPRATRSGSRFAIRIRVDRRLAARRIKATVVQRISRGRLVRRSTKRITLRTTTRFRSRPVPRGWRLTVTVRVPRTSIDGAPVNATTKTVIRRR